MPLNASSDTANDAADRLRAWVQRLEELGRDDEARQVLDDALKDPFGPLAIQQERTAKLVAGGDKGVASLAAPEPSDAELEVGAWAAWLSGQERHDDARRAVAEAIAAHGRTVFLLTCAADTERDADAKHAALWFRREAYRLAPGEIDVACSLAQSLGTMLIAPQLVYRADEALGILDGLGDQTDPRIRINRAMLLKRLDAPAARVAAAYGPIASLPEDAANRARRYRRRSAGPLGQWCIRISDRIRSEGRERAHAEEIVRTEAESEAVARVLDSLNGLQPSEARVRIEAAMEEHGRQPALLLACANAERSGETYWHALAVAGEAVHASPDSLDAVCSLAWHCDVMYGYGTALQVLASLPTAARRTADARVLAGNLHRWAGNFARAVTAFGDPRDLPGYARIWRRQCIRKALLRPTFALLARGQVAAADLSKPIAPPPAIARVLDRQTEFAGDPPKLYELLDAAIAQHGRHPRLLLALADVEVRFGDEHSGAALANEALRAAPEDPLIVGYVINTLWRADRDADALRTIRELSQPLKQAPYVRRAAGQVLRYWRLWAHATAMYGRVGLTAAEWSRRQGCWRRRGGPLKSLRSRLMAIEDDLLTDWPMSYGQAAVLPALRLPDSVAVALRGDLTSYHFGRKYHAIFRRQRLDFWLSKIANLVNTLILLAVFTIVAHAHWPKLAVAFDFAAAVIAAGAAEGAAWLFNKATGRMVTRLAVAAGCGVGAGLLLTSADRWKFGVGAELTAFVALVAVTAVLRPIAQFRLKKLTAPWRQEHAEYAVLSDLLDALAELHVPRERFDANGRRAVMVTLESAATTVERDLPRALRTEDGASQRAIAARARGAAHRLREIKLALALPVERSVKDAVDSLTELAMALAGHDFEHWPAPLPESPTVRASQSRWQRATTIVRTILVIFGPPLVAYLLPLVAPLTGPTLSWLRLGTIVWALIGAVVTLDPAFNERSRKMREMLAFLRDAMSTASPKDTDKAAVRNESVAPSAAEAAGQAEGEDPRRAPHIAI